MSRSYKKSNYCGDKKDKELKRLANHRVRQRLKNNLDYTPSLEILSVCLKAGRFVTTDGCVHGKNTGIVSVNGIIVTTQSVGLAIKTLPTMRKNIASGIVTTK